VSKDAKQLSGVAAVPLHAVDPIELPNGSWSRMLVTKQTIGENSSSLGYSVFTPGTILSPVSHQTEEVAYVVSGTGELLLGPEPAGQEAKVPFREGDALFIPAGEWHAVANTGDGDVIMVFCFPCPDYPPTERSAPVSGSAS
jgi:oxalate decarboxylase/phosphoglucose isomerase-like protein (cupin superfamily)